MNYELYFTTRKKPSSSADLKSTSSVCGRATSKALQLESGDGVDGLVRSR